MRSISKLFSAALMLILAAACNTKEIDNPDNPDKPKAYDNIILTAGINQTRVDYKVDNGKLVPGWVEGDVIFGYFGSGDGSQIEFTVEDLNDDGTAVLSPGEGWDDFLQQFKSLGDGEKLPIGLIYTGSKASYSPENPNDVIVSMTSQNGVNIPACMHASKYQVVKQDDTQIIRFLFDNDCAIFEIESLTGIAEDAGLTNDETLSLTSLTVTNLIPTYEYSYASGELSGKSGTEKLISYEIDLSESSWEVDYEGNINHSPEKNLLVAVAPNSVDNDILITATAEDGRQFSYLYHGDLVGGQCYIINKRDVVAKTEDGQYFKTVYDAFEHAEYLDGNPSLLQGRTNTVTLLVDEINGLGEQVEKPAYDKSITIDYDVTLELNGCALTIDGYESFIVQETGDFTITDSRYDDETGYLWSETPEEDVPVIENIGRVSITSACVCSDNLTVDNEGGVLDVVGSDIQSFYDITINNTGEVKIFDSAITSGEVDYPKRKYYAGDYVINNEGKCSLEISNSNVSFVDGLDDGSQKTAVIYFKNSNNGENNFAYFKMDGGEVSGGTVITGENVVYSRAEAIQLFGNVKATISGNAEVNSDSFNAVTLAPIEKIIEEEVVSIPAGELTITGGTITSTDGNAIVNYGDLTISGGTISSSYYTIDNYGDLEILGGIVYCDDDYSAIYGNKGSTTSLGSIENKDAPLVYTMAETDDDGICPAIWIEAGAGFSMEGGTVEAKGKGAAIWLYADQACVISGGSISSKDSFAIDNGSMLTITGGTLTSTNSNAIYSGKGSVTIGTADGDDDDITITSESNDINPHAAIYINNGTFTMYSGTVSGEGKWCALEINGANSSGSLTGPPSGEIFGGKLVSQQYHTLAVEYGGTCTVSGGELYCLGSAYSTINVKNGDLEINWPKGTVFPTGYDSPSGKLFPEGLPAEPLIFCCSTQFAPIEAPDIDMNNANTGTVKINGGYLFACNYSAASESSRDYYADDSRLTKTQDDPAYTDSVLKSCGHFFSTVYNLDYDSNVPDSISQPYHCSVSGTSPVDYLFDSSWLPTEDGYSWYYIY